MGAAVSELADIAYVTSDNPRSEDPQVILDDISVGLAEDCEAHFEFDRRVAIRSALREARSGDLVLIAGKGHETVQVIGEVRHPFDDAQVAREEWL